MLFRVKRLFINNFAKYVGQKRFKHAEFEPIFERVKLFWNKTAIHDYKGRYTYGNVFLSANELSQNISRELGGKIQERVLFLCSNDVNYVVTLLAIWMSGQTAVPLSPLHPENVINYYAEDTKSKLLLSTPEHAEIISKIAKRVGTNMFVMDENLTSKYSNNSATICDQESCLTMPTEIYEYSDGMIIYTSGTTGKPKGVVLPHKTLFFQTKTLVDAWKWSSDDIILHTLPLHHIHGVVNALFCPLYTGATTVMLPRFSAEAVWSYLLGKHKGRQISVFMAVPTIYAKLVEEFEEKYANKRDEVKNFLKENVRLMVSGSAPLPTALHKKWFEITGHKLLERYGMTEIGMCLSNEYNSDRAPGYVGVPLPGVSVRLVEKNEETNTYNVLLECANRNGSIKFNKTIDGYVKGELLVKGENVFKEYFNKPKTTKKEFTEDGWFITGDICEYAAERKRFRMLGRKSVDIIKSGGYKISSLQIETSLLAHPEIKECAVLGVEDPTWGEKIVAIVVPEPGCDVNLDSLRNWASDKMPKYHLPTKLQIMTSIPKNAMGKVNKKELKSIFSK